MGLKERGEEKRRAHGTPAREAINNMKEDIDDGCGWQVDFMGNLADIQRATTSTIVIATYQRTANKLHDVEAIVKEERRKKQQRQSRCCTA